MGFIEEDITRDEKGRLLPGHGGLKPKGANSRLPNEIKNKITEFLAGKIETLEEVYSQASTKDKLRFLTELLSYVLPKSKELKIETNEALQTPDFEKLSDNDLRDLERIQRTLKQL